MPLLHWLSHANVVCFLFPSWQVDRDWYICISHRPSAVS